MGNLLVAFKWMLSHTGQKTDAAFCELDLCFWMYYYLLLGCYSRAVKGETSALLSLTLSVVRKATCLKCSVHVRLLPSLE